MITYPLSTNLATLWLPNYSASICQRINGYTITKRQYANLSMIKYSAKICHSINDYIFTRQQSTLLSMVTYSLTICNSVNDYILRNSQQPYKWLHTDAATICNHINNNILTQQQSTSLLLTTCPLSSNPPTYQCLDTHSATVFQHIVFTYPLSNNLSIFITLNEIISTDMKDHFLAFRRAVLMVMAHYSFRLFTA